MDHNTAKKYVESLIFSSLEPLGKNDMRKCYQNMVTLI